MSTKKQTIEKIKKWIQDTRSTIKILESNENIGFSSEVFRLENFRNIARKETEIYAYKRVLRLMGVDDE